jgi:mannan endo-1,4-beta-mannosidase
MKRNWLGIVGITTTLMLISAYPSEPESLVLVSFGTEASPNKKRLLNYLTDEYGRRVISGQMDTSWTTNTSMDMIARVFADTGKYPAIKGFDFIQLNYDSGREQTNEAIEWWNGKNNGVALLPDKASVHGIVTFCWHWKVGNKDFYTKNTDFRIPYKDGKLDTASSNFRLITTDLDKVAIQLQRLKDLDIPVLWRPLHEASGGWFWWGASGPAPYIALWEYIYDYLAVKKGLNNLIWVWNGQNAAWFPNVATVDIVGTDVYPGAKNYGSQAGKFAETLNMVPGRNRMVALSENGAIPDPDNCKNITPCGHGL